MRKLTPQERAKWENIQRIAYMEDRLPQKRIADLEARPGWTWQLPK
jgi:hypothetical protein